MPILVGKINSFEIKQSPGSNREGDPMSVKKVFKKTKILFVKSHKKGGLMLKFKDETW